MGEQCQVLLECVPEKVSQRTSSHSERSGERKADNAMIIPHTHTHTHTPNTLTAMTPDIYIHLVWMVSAGRR